MSRKIIRFLPPQPPTLEQLPLINAESQAAHWLDHYWRKLKLPSDQARYLALTDDRREFAVAVSAASAVVLEDDFLYASGTKPACRCRRHMFAVEGSTALPQAAGLARERLQLNSLSAPRPA